MQQACKGCATLLESWLKRRQRQHLVNKQVLAAAFGGDEAVALGAVEPLASSANLRHAVRLFTASCLWYDYCLLLLERAQIRIER